jgi:hypothetical protein
MPSAVEPAPFSTSERESRWTHFYLLLATVDHDRNAEFEINQQLPQSYLKSARPDASLDQESKFDESEYIVIIRLSKCLKAK